MNIGLNDILAFGDVLDALAEEADSMGIARALEVQEALAEATKKLALTVALVKARTLTEAREPVRVGDAIYHAEPTGKWRPDQGKVRRQVVERAVFDGDGQFVTESRVAAARAVGLMFDLYVAPQDMPKVGGLKKLRMTKEDVATWEHTGQELVVNKVKVEGE